MTMGLQGYGQPGDWQDDIYYPIGQTVADRGGIWRALTQNRNSQPVSGNTDWTLVGGIPYTITTLTPAQIQTLHTTAQTLVPLAGANVIVVPYTTAVIQSSAAADFSGSVTINIGWGPDPTTGPDSTQIPLQAWSSLPTSAFASIYGQFGSGTMSLLDIANSVDLRNLPIVITSGADVTGGDGTLTVIQTYTLVDLAPYLTSPFFLITAVDQTNQAFTVSADPTSDVIVGTSVAVVGSTGNDGTYTVTVVAAAAGPDNITVVNQGTKKFTIAGNHAAEYPAGSIATVAGSTGNDGAYTVVSAVFGTATVIAVSEAIPNATADGTIEMTDQIVVAQALPDSTADGWVEVS